MNEHTISYGRTADYAVRLLRAALLTQVKKVKPVDPASGKMPVGVIKDLDALGDSVFEDMAAKGWLSFGKMLTDKNSDIVVAKSVDASFYLITYGNIGQINGKINVKVRA